MSDPAPAVPSEPTPAPPRKRTALVLTLVGLLVIGAGIFVIVPNFIHFASRSKQAEAKSNLKALYTAERAYLQEKDTYAADVVAIGFSPEKGNRYAYFLAPEGKAWLRDKAGGDGPVGPGVAIISEDLVRFDTSKGAIPLRYLDTGCPLTMPVVGDWKRAGLGMTGEGLGGVFVGAAVGNIDTDPDLDCWSVATVDRVDRDGGKIPAGVPFNEAKDIRD